MSDLELNKYYYRCYDHDVLIPFWKINDMFVAGHGDCHNVRKLTMPEFIEQVIKDFKDSGFELQGVSGYQQIRLKNLKFILELIKKYGVYGD